MMAATLVAPDWRNRMGGVLLYLGALVGRGLLRMVNDYMER